MNRSLKLSMLMALGLASSNALALGLGQVQVKSTLNSPLVVEIPLVLDYAGEANNVQVALATPEDFARAGINRAQLKVPLQFAIVTNAQGQKVVRITTTEPVRSPYLDFLMQVNWPKGRMLREYTVLLDPPNMPAAVPTTAPVAAPVAAPSRISVPAPSPVRQTPSRPAPRQSAPVRRAPANPAQANVSRIHDGKYGPVQAGQALSVIAVATRMSGVSVDQMMLALKSANPDAFYRDNINALKRGAVLRIPTRAEAEALTAAAAHAAARQQNLDWSNGVSAPAPSTVASAGNHGTAGSSNAAPRSAGDRLALVPPGNNGNNASTAGNSAAVKTLNQELTRTKESLSNEQQQNSVLDSRVKDLEQLSAKNKRLLSMKDAQIAELQQQLAAARKSAGQAAKAPETGSAASGKSAVATPVPPTAAAVASASTASSAAQAADHPAAQTVPLAQSKPATEVAASQPAAGKKPAAHAAASPAPMAPAQPWYRQLWVMIAAGVIIVLLILAALFGRRGDKSDKVAPASLADQFGESPLDRGSSGDGQASAAYDTDAEMDADQQDLLQQLAENPDDIGLHLELVSLYYARHDVDGFEAAAEAMYAHVSDPQQAEWLDVVAMGEELAPGHPLFSGSEPVDITSHDSLAEFDVDDYARDASADAAPDAKPAEPERSFSYNFNLTPGHHAEPPSSVVDADDGMDEPTTDTHPAPPESDAATVFADAHVPGLDEPETHDAGMYTDDPVDTKLDLARAYMDMGDHDGARSMLQEVTTEGNRMQQEVARKLLDELG